MAKNEGMTTFASGSEIVQQCDSAMLPYVGMLRNTCTNTVNTQMSAAALIFSATALLRLLFGCGALLSAALIFQPLFRYGAYLGYFLIL